MSKNINAATNMLMNYKLPQSKPFQEVRQEKDELELAQAKGDKKLAGNKQDADRGKKESNTGGVTS